MRPRPIIRIVGAALVAGISGLGLIQVEAQTARASAIIVRQSGVQQELHQGTNCPGDMDLLSIRVINNRAVANNFVTYTVEGVPSGVIGFSWSQSGPFEDTLDVTVAVDASGNGESGNFYIRAMDSGVAHVRACSDLVGCVDNPFDITVAGIERVELVAIDSPLDNNPNPGGGKRIYPDWVNQLDTVERRTVTVRAHVGAALPGVPVYFQSFDVDDPSSDERPVDANGPRGDDNHGRPQAGALNRTLVATDYAGIAETTLMVTTQPGDNFKVAASCRAGYLTGVTAQQTDLVDSAGHTLPTDRAAVSELLTVWRRLHVEVDSMGLVSGNQTRGIVLDVASRRTGPYKVTLDIDGPLERQRFRGGLITISGVGSFAVVDNDADSVMVAASLDGATVAGRTFVLVDDDDHNNDDGFFGLDGDEGENLPMPDLSMLADGRDDGVCNGSGLNPFGAAYICPVFDIGDDNDFVPFFRHSPRPPAVVATYDFDAIATEQSAGFWTVYVLGAYQAEAERDFDPIEERSTLARVDDINGMGASIFQEVITDGERARGQFVIGCSNALNVVHELGHLLAGTHPEGGLMGSPCDAATTTFSPKSIVTFRKLIFP